MEASNRGDSLAAEAARLKDAYARRRRQYSWSSEGHLFGHQDRERNTLALLNRQGSFPLGQKTFLEVGCGTGTWLQQFIRWGARPDHVTGIDLNPERLAQARANIPEAARLEQVNAAAMPYAAASFDIVLQSTMFTSVLDAGVRRQIASEMLRVLRPDGLIIWYDFWMNNPKNPDVRGVGRKEVLSLFPQCRVDLRRVTLVPPVLRWLAPRSWFLTYAASQIPPFCTHFMGAITKR
jgi:ubiquinone/menaquinone biosynthesis C-methylase UbiE